MPSDIKTLLFAALALLGSLWLARLWQQAPKHNYTIGRSRLLFYAVILGGLAVAMVVKWIRG